eukprot:61532-Chlamydomonas_euryale.AAC.1
MSLSIVLCCAGSWPVNWQPAAPFTAFTFCMSHTVEGRWSGKCQPATSPAAFTLCTPHTALVWCHRPVNCQPATHAPQQPPVCPHTTLSNLLCAPTPHWYASSTYSMSMHSIYHAPGRQAVV